MAYIAYNQEVIYLFDDFVTHVKPCISLSDFQSMEFYCRIVGDDDGGVLFTPKQYEAYKKKIIPQRMANRLFVSWASPNGIECKMVGPETMCFCRHR